MIEPVLNAPTISGPPYRRWPIAFVSALLVVGCSTTPRMEERPTNVLVVLVDTLRADRLSAYGYRREISPEIQRLVADQGTVVETAYAPAPWTLPSMVGLMTGRTPGELAGGSGAYEIPEGVPTLAERMADLGFATAAFYGNPTLHAGNGFARGFDTFYTPPPEIASLSLHADSLNRRAMPWLREHQHQPFFLYLHYLDPHDPYENPDMPEGRSPWLPEYEGALTGASVHGVYVGSVELEDPERDAAYLSSLYDGEVRYVDRHIGELLAVLDPDVLAETLVILTSDHGEELYDHGGWKHGDNLYQEQIRVPLIFRWDTGGIPAGARLSGTVSLLDLVPTVLSAVGGTSEAGWAGIDLMPVLRRGEPLPPRPAYVRHFGRGPLRAAAILGNHKLILFNSGAHFAPRDAVEEHLWRLDLARFERAELYDLDEDPLERRNRGAVDPEARRLEGVLRHHLNRELGGLRLEIAPGSGGRVRGQVSFEQAPESWEAFFLAEGDQVELVGAVLSFDIGREAFAKGLSLRGGPGGIAQMRIELDGQPVPDRRLLVGDGEPYRGGRLDPEALVSFGGPRGVGDPPAVLALWLQDAALSGEERDAETTRRLKALGYL